MINEKRTKKKKYKLIVDCLTRQPSFGWSRFFFFNKWCAKLTHTDSSSANIFRLVRRKSIFYARKWYCRSSAYEHWAMSIVISNGNPVSFSLLRNAFGFCFGYRYLMILIHFSGPATSRSTQLKTAEPIGFRAQCHAYRAEITCNHFDLANFVFSCFASPFHYFIRLEWRLECAQHEQVLHTEHLERLNIRYNFERENTVTAVPSRVTVEPRGIRRRRRRRSTKTKFQDTNTQHTSEMVRIIASLHFIHKVTHYVYGVRTLHLPRFDEA